VLEISYGGTSAAIPSNPIPLNTWVWVGTYSHSRGQLGTCTCVAAFLTVDVPGEVTLTSASAGGVQGFYQVDSGLGPSYATSFGWGVSQSSGYANAANTPGLRMSKFAAHYGTPSFLTADTNGDTQDYMVRQYLGAAAQLDDTSGNGYHLTPGPQGLTSYQPGPYVSPFAPASLPTGPSNYEVGCGCNPVEGKTTDSATGYPVNTATGDFYHAFTDLSIPGRGIPLRVTRTYNSLFAAQDGPFGFGWSANDTAAITADVTGVVTVTQENGTTVTFDRTPSGYAAPSRVRATLVDNGNGTLTFDDVHALTAMMFTAPTTATGGQLIGITDRNGYTTALTYTNGLLSRVTDPSGRSLTFGYSGRHIARVVDPIGRTAAYTYNVAGDLTDAQDVRGYAWHFTYDS